MKDSKIEWCDHTFNGWIGCTKVSPACDNCYAAASTPARTMGIEWGTGKPRHRTSAANWKQPLLWDKLAKSAGVRHKVFCSSLADVFDNEVDPQWRADLVALMHDTPNLDWLILTKRIGNAHLMLNEAWETLAYGIHDYDYVVRNGAPLANVWIGATICNQAEADRDIPKLLAVPAAKRFLSIEPLLGAIDLSEPFNVKHWGFDPDWEGSKTDIDWVIVGGESGNNARPMHPDWVHNLRDQCAAAGVAFLFKQWGEWQPIEVLEWDGKSKAIVANFSDDQAYVLTGKAIPRAIMDTDTTLGVAEYQTFQKVGKKAAGRLLDGVEHNGVPA
jgi:protein gp37